jgi:hypothetical protein
VPVYLSVAAAPGLRSGLFAQGQLQTGQVRAVAVPLGAVRTDKPQPYVQAIVQGKVVHLPATMGIRGEYQGQTMVALEDMGPGLRVLRGSVGPLLAGTPVNYTNGVAVGGVVASDANLSIRSGFGRGSAFGGDFSPRDFNGSITYTIGAGSVPEPASWALLLAGFGLTGAVARRRRTAVSA